MNSPNIEPMLAVPVDLEKGPTDSRFDNYWMEPKLDGVRCIATKLDGQVTLTSRGGKSFTEKLPHIVIQLATIRGDFILDGELGYTMHPLHSEEQWPIIDFNATMRVLGSGVEVALQKQRERGVLHRIQFLVFDMLTPPGKYDEGVVDLSIVNDTRVGLLKDFFDEHFESLPHVNQVDWHNSYDEAIFESYVAAGGEGVMLKNPGGLYVPGKRRANTWYKLKKYETMDVVIDGTEYLPGQGKYEGQIGALYFGQYNKQYQFVRLGKCSGMTDQQRSTFTSHWRLIQWQTMEIKYYGNVGKDGAGLRHPQFMRLRPDKNPYWCTMTS